MLLLSINGQKAVSNANINTNTFIKPEAKLWNKCEYTKKSFVPDPKFPPFKSFKVGGEWPLHRLTENNCMEKCDQRQDCFSYIYKVLKETTACFLFNKKFQRNSLNGKNMLNHESGVNYNVIYKEKESCDKCYYERHRFVSIPSEKDANIVAILTSNSTENYGKFQDRCFQTCDNTVPCFSLVLIEKQQMCVLYNRQITKGDFKITEFIDKNDNNCGILWLKKNCNPPEMRIPVKVFFSSGCLGVCSKYQMKEQDLDITALKDNNPKTFLEINGSNLLNCFTLNLSFQDVERKITVIVTPCTRSEHYVIMDFGHGDTVFKSCKPMGSSAKQGEKACVYSCEVEKSTPEMKIRVFDPNNKDFQLSGIEVIKDSQATQLLPGGTSMRKA
ncbi:DgyrCDS824 [Dimorphilus gyrociliatus]|uniref:DgyrCDS824 n=1 Tax=Dimorphilus gyrociliatus TaxID=2664684 RepID=A0A7I8V7A0_9ANNE|nr:DgyrCDS824 [Dimorphilus gyrociliatus]